MGIAFTNEIAGVSREVVDVIDVAGGPADLDPVCLAG